MANPDAGPRARSAATEDADFYSIDWMNASTLLETRRQSSHSLRNHASLAEHALQYLGALQSWVVLAIAGSLTAVLAGCIEVGVEVLSDLKFGYCRNHFWLSRHVCCLEHQLSGHCPSWVRWADFVASNASPGHFINYVCFVAVAVLFAGLSAWFVKVFAIYAAGSGIAEVKVLVGGYVMHGYLGGWTLLIKCIGLVLSVSSGLNLGKEGPLVHVACCCCNIVARMFPKFRNEARRLELISAASAAGVAAAFGAPIGGVLFSIEEASHFFSHKTMWRAFFCANITALVLSFVNPLHTFRVVLFQVHYTSSWNWFEMVPFLILGCIGGFVGTLMTKAIGIMANFRENSGFATFPIKETIVVTGVSALINFYHPLLSLNAAPLIGELFSECSVTNMSQLPFLCDESATTYVVVLLVFGAIIKFFLTILTFGLRVPAGIFIPSLAIGACIGRLTGIIMQSLLRAYPDSTFFAECAHGSCITPGVYALVGAAAVLAGVTRITLSLVVIMFELTGDVKYLLPLMLPIMCSKWIADVFGPGLYDEHIRRLGFPFLDIKLETKSMIPVHRIMSSTNLVCFSAHSTTVGEIQQALKNYKYRTFPVVLDRTSFSIVGSVSRTALTSALGSALQRRSITPNTVCNLSMSPPPLPTQSPGARATESDAAAARSLGLAAPREMANLFSSSVLDLSHTLDPAPIIMTAATPFHHIFDMFKKLGLRYVLVVRDGRLVGIATRRDVLAAVEDDLPDTTLLDPDNSFNL